MPIYTVSIFKRLNETGHVWSNQYFVTAANDLDADDIGGNITFIEQSIHRENVEFFQRNVRQAGVGHIGIQRGFSLSGTVPMPETGDMLPLWNVVMVSYSSGVDRNDRKFLRLPLFPNEVNGDVLSNAKRADVDLLYSTPLLGLPGVVNTWGRGLVSVSCSARVHDRDLSWKRRVRPGFHRGWVAD